jgi:hypothetical protein
MGRFSDIKRGGDLKAKLDAYALYLQNPPARRLNSQGDRAPSQQAYLVPFSLNLETDEVVAVTANRDGYTQLANAVNQGAKSEVLNALGSKTVADVGRFRPARVNVFQNATKTKTTPNSRFTGKPYLKYAGDSYSCPFGRKAAADRLQDSFGIIRAALKARPNLLVNRISLQPERVFD